MRLPRAVILMYHHVGTGLSDPEEAFYSLEADLFEAQMRLLALKERSVVSLLALGTGDYPDGSVALTFDDGWQSDFSVAAPVLRAHGFPAAFFINPARMEQEGRLSWAQLRALADEGFLIGSHGLDHTLLDRLPERELEYQLVESKRQLEERLERPIRALSLPGGSGGERALVASRAAGYDLILGSRPAPVCGRSGPGILPRLALRRGQGLFSFAALVEQRRLHLLRHAVRYRAIHGARRVLGMGAYTWLRLLWLGRTGPESRG